MAVMSAAERAACSAELIREISSANQNPGAVTKADVRAAVDALDTWLNDNAATINLAIPQPVRAQFSTQQKARLLLAVIRRRFITGA